MNQVIAMGVAGRRLALRLRTESGDDLLRDRISDLPDHLAHSIMMLLPTEDSVRTVTLSKRWREIWWTYPVHDFDETRYNDRAELVTAMMDGLARGNGLNPTVQKLRVFTVYPSDPFVQHNTEIYIEYGITESKLLELELTFHGMYCYAQSDYFPSEFFLPDNVFTSGIYLTSLKLQACDCGPCEDFNLPSLKTVFFKFLTIDDRTLELLIANCPILEELRVEFCYELNVLRVRNPSLTSLCVGSSDDLSLLEMAVPKLRCFRYSGAYLSPDGPADGSDEACSEIMRFECPEEANGFDELRTVSISNVTMTDDVTEKMFLKFHHMASVRLAGCELPTINLASNTKLETIDINGCEFERVRVSKQSLKNFGVSSHAFVSNRAYENLLGSVFMSLCSIVLGGNIYFPDGLFRFSGGSQLQSLVLQSCMGLSRIELSSPTLKRFDLELCMELESGRVDAPALEYFKFIGEICVFEAMDVSDDVIVDLNMIEYGPQIEPSEAEAHDQQLYLFLGLFHFAKAVKIQTEQTDCKIIPESLDRRPAFRFPDELNVKTEYPGKSYLLYLKDILSLSFCVNTINLNVCSFQVELKFHTPANMDALMKHGNRINLESFNHDCVARHLNTVKIANFHGSSDEIDLVHYLLGAATRLTALSVTFNDDVGAAEGDRIASDVTSCHVASTGSVTFGFICANA